MRATVDLLNIVGVAVLVVISTSTAGVVGAAVLDGQFDTEDQGEDEKQVVSLTEAQVTTEESPSGGTTVRWVEPGDAIRIEIRDPEGTVVDSLNIAGEETTVSAEEFDVYAIYEDSPSVLLQQERNSG